jgi:hypothetical protein
MANYISTFLTPVKEYFKADTILQTALDTLKKCAAERDCQDGERSMKAAVEAFNALTGHKLSIREGWVFMNILKLARAQNGKTNIDDYVDASAYAALACEEAANNEGK